MPFVTFANKNWSEFLWITVTAAAGKVIDGLETKKREVSARMFSDNEEISIEEPEIEVQAEPETTETQWNY